MSIETTGCSRCPAWKVSNIKCSNCGTVMPYKHRESVDAGIKATRSNYRCVVCNLTGFDTL